MPTRLQTVRHHLDYTAAQVIDLLTRADALNLPIATKPSLKTKLSRWENGKEQPSNVYQRLFREIYGRTNAELGFPDEPEEDPEVSELRSRLAVARTVDAQTVDLFFQQIDHARKVDRRFGGLTQLDPLRAQIRQVQDLLMHSIGARAQLAGALMEASTLAGWQSLDRAALGQAWTHYERAKTAARESTSPPRSPTPSANKPSYSSTSARPRRPARLRPQSRHPQHLSPAPGLAGRRAR